MIVDFITWHYKRKDKSIHKIRRDTQTYPANFMETKTRNKIWSVTVTDELSEMCTQTRILCLIRMQI